MKRLTYHLSGMEQNTASYEMMYDGLMKVRSRNRYLGADPVDHTPHYFRGNIGYEITAPHKLAHDRPCIKICIPLSEIFENTKESLPMKRLKYHLLQMEKETYTYKEMYEGEKIVFPPPSSDPCSDEQQPWREQDADYYYKQSMLSIENTHKLAQDKPTLVWRIPAELLGIDSYTSVAADYCLRAFKPYIDALNEPLYNRGRPDNEKGKYYLYSPGGEVLLRNTAFFSLCPQRDYDYGSGYSVYLYDDDQPRPPQMCLCIRMQVQLPKRNLRKTIQMLCRDLPDAVDDFINNFDPIPLYQALELAEKQTAIRSWLKNSEYCAFIANGSILPRSKNSDLPMTNAIPFRSTPEDEISICGVTGMGIKRGVTVITGGGYSGKSTLLDAISSGIYDHIAGDGRELCITDPSAVTISAEDGRSIKRVNISPFIKWTPCADTTDFSTERASGSTSQAANIIEAVDNGSKLLLLDEDRSATNFMIRDRMMKELIEKEPITPFTDRVRELLSRHRVSTILVIGGSGEYLSVADKVYMMNDFVIQDVTPRAKDLCANNRVISEAPEEANWRQQRALKHEGFTSYPENASSEKLCISEMGFIMIGDEKIDVRGLHNIITPNQIYALGFILRYLQLFNGDDTIDLTKSIDMLYCKIQEEGLDIVYSSYFTTCERFLDLPRKQEVLACINRMRKVTFEKGLSH